MTPVGQAALDDHGRYQELGQTWLTCPRLVELDPRHGIRNDIWPATWRNPGHPRFLNDPEGHDSNLFLRGPRSRPLTADEWPSCQGCGRKLVATDGDSI